MPPASPRTNTSFTPKRGRPTANQVAAIDNAILEIASRMFLDQGYAVTSMEAVANAAGVSKGTLYARYPTKAELFEAIVTVRLANWKAPPVETAGMDMRAILRQYGLDFFTSVRQPEAIAFNRLIMAEAARFPVLARKFHDEGYESGVDLLARDIRRLAARADMEVGNPWAVANAFMAALLGWMRKETLSHPITQKECEGFTEQLVTIFVDGQKGW